MSTAERTADVVDHILRPHPPWRAAEFLTECGHQASEYASVISRDDLVAKLKAQGKQRAAMSTCMTCWHSAEDNPGWERNPVAVIQRECNRANWWRGMRQPPPKAVNFTTELRALAALVDAHKDEFNELLGGLAGAVSLDEQRAKRQRGRRG